MAAGIADNPLASVEVRSSCDPGRLEDTAVVVAVRTALIGCGPVEVPGVVLQVVVAC